MNKKFFGNMASGEEVSLYALKNADTEVTFTDYGAAIVSLTVFGKDVVGGFDTLSDYLTDDSHQGATIGRVANRVADARFTMDGKEYRITENDNGNCLHGGVGFDFKVWRVKEHTDTRIVFEYKSVDGEEGFPANVDVTVSYTLSGTELIIDYKAVPDGKTPISLTNHSYFNLGGFGGDILGHTLTIYADRYTKVGSNLIPTGERPAVIGTPFDFTMPHKIGERIGETDGGYDHNYILCPKLYKEYCKKSLGLAAELSGDKIKMQVYTDQVGIQFYTGNFLGSGRDFKGGIKQIKHGALCLETQIEPNSINSGVGFYDRGEVYTQTTVYSFDKI